MKYRGITDRGRQVLEDSLESCVASLAHTMSTTTAELVVDKEDIGDLPESLQRWFIYDSKDEQAADISDGLRFRWIAIVRVEP